MRLSRRAMLLAVFVTLLLGLTTGRSLADPCTALPSGIVLPPGITIPGCASGVAALPGSPTEMPTPRAPSSDAIPLDPGASTVTSISGLYLGDQAWSGQVLVTGDVLVFGDLTMAPGTTVRVAVGDDQAQGSEVAPDGVNDNDPTRLLSYATTHTDIDVSGRLFAQGTADQPIVFTSASASPALADWQGLGFAGDGSSLSHVIVEYSRNGVTPGPNQPDSMLRDSIVRHAMWGCVSSGQSAMQILDNDISDCGHEGIDVRDGSAVIEGNTIHDSHSGIVVLNGSPTIDGNTLSDVSDGIGVPNATATPIIGENTITLAPPDSTMEWRYGNFAYRMYN